MSRTQKGSKGPGWEPWSNRHEKEKLRAEQHEDPSQHAHEETCMYLRGHACNCDYGEASSGAADRRDGNE